MDIIPFRRGQIRNFLEAKYQGIVYKSNWQLWFTNSFRQHVGIFEYKDGQGWESTSDPAIAGSWYNITGVRAGMHQYLYVNECALIPLLCRGHEQIRELPTWICKSGIVQDGGLEPDRFLMEDR